MLKLLAPCCSRCPLLLHRRRRPSSAAEQKEELGADRPRVSAEESGGPARGDAGARAQAADGRRRTAHKARWRKAMRRRSSAAEGDLVAGNPKGKVTMVEFFDYNCGYCKRAFPDVMKMIETDKDLQAGDEGISDPRPGLGLCRARRARLAQAGQILGVSPRAHGHEGRIDEAVADEIAKGRRARCRRSSRPTWRHRGVATSSAPT